MAGDWIKMRGNLWDDPRVARLCDLTDQQEAMVIGGLYWLWATADQHSEDGVMPGLTLRQIDRKTGVKGMAEALIAIGWLADHPEGVHIIRFEEHNGASAKKRAVTAKRVANHRAGNDDVTPEALQNEHASVTGALAREREEKEKEKEKKEIQVRAAALTPPVGVSDSVWSDFLKIRKAKKSPMTTAALDGIRREAEKAGWGLEEVLTECCVRGWQGFKAEWVADKPKTFAQVAADVIRTTVPSKPERDPTLVLIEQDAKRAAPIPANIREKLAALKGANYA
jgi:hypothetical protein